MIFFSEGNTVYKTLTSQVNELEINFSTSENIFPTLLQNQIQKKYEIRIFYIQGICYSMAMFSQLNNKTEVDFRNYDQENPVRNIPYLLPKRISKKIVLLMNTLQYFTGSIDMIVDTNNEYIFLEINPIGQFGMVSYPCNYGLEKIIAQSLCE